MKKALFIISILMLITNCITAQNWSLTGNSGSSPSTNFLGTTDDQDLVFKTNSTEVFRLGSSDHLPTFDAGDNITSAHFKGSNYYGQWIHLNSITENPSAGVGYRMMLNNSIKSQLFYNGGSFSYGTTLHGIKGNVELVSMEGDVLLSTNWFRTNSFIVKNTTGYVGIGTLTPGNKVEITQGTSGNSGLRFTNLTSSSSAGTSSGKVLSVNSSGDVILESASGGSAPDGSETKVTAGTNVTVTGSGTIASPYQISSSSPWSASGVGTNNIINNNSGAVLIGTGITTAPSGYKLYVSGGILTEKVKAALKSGSNWADFVFGKGYILRPLSEVESYIKYNNHLPDMPSAEELVSGGGIDMNDMFAKQMQKIEELTLYIIEMKKEIVDLQKQNAALKTGNPIIKN